MKKWRKRIVLTLFICILSGSPLAFAGFNYFFMPLYSNFQSRNNLLKKEGITLSIPGGSASENQDWYPHVLTFDPGTSFSSYSGIEGELAILYNFPAFDSALCSSRLYDSASPYYNSFYGAYAVRGYRKTFGFDEDGRLVPEEVVLVPEYDFKVLVMEGFGLERSQSEFHWTITSIKKGLDYVNLSGWIKSEADLTVTGAAHNPSSFSPSWIQYGKPYPSEFPDFQAVPMKGRIYTKYFDEWNVTICFYIIGTSEEMIEVCDSEILSNSLLY